MNRVSAIDALHAAKDKLAVGDRIYKQVNSNAEQKLAFKVFTKELKLLRDINSDGNCLSIGQTFRDSKFWVFVEKHELDQTTFIKRVSGEVEKL